jgi:ssDNA-binding Zn-finger/Zn-ribbon topoisomerase 1
MERMTLEAVLAATVDVDVCRGCRAFWFDPFETLHLTPAATLQLFRLIADAAHEGQTAALPAPLRCPKCRAQLKLARDRQRNTPFQYWRCDQGHGRFTRFHDFLKEKNFIQPLTPQQLAELRQRVRTVNCSNCGAAVDLVQDSACTYCQSPLTMLDLDKMAEVAREYQRAADRPRAVLVPPLLREPVSDPFSNLLTHDLETVRGWLAVLFAVRR